MLLLEFSIKYLFIKESLQFINHVTFGVFFFPKPLFYFINFNKQNPNLKFLNRNSPSVILTCCYLQSFHSRQINNKIRLERAKNYKVKLITKMFKLINNSLTRSLTRIKPNNLSVLSQKYSSDPPSRMEKSKFLKI